MSPMNPRLLRPTRRAPSGPTDPLFAQVKMLLHFDGGFTNSASSGIAVSPQGGASISSSVKKFGSGAAAFNGESDYAEADWSSLPSFGDASTPYTVEMWAYISSQNQATQILFVRHGGTASWQETDGGLNVNMYVDDSSVICEFQSETGSEGLYGTVLRDQWAHIALSYDGMLTRLFVNGTEQASSNASYNTVLATDTLEIGRQIDSLYLLGYIDEFRVTVGATAGRYTANFTPPTSAFPNA